MCTNTSKYHIDATSAMLPRPPVARKLEASEDMEDNTDDEL